MILEILNDNLIDFVIYAVSVTMATFLAEKKPAQITQPLKQRSKSAMCLSIFIIGFWSFLNIFVTLDGYFKNGIIEYNSTR